MKLMSKKQLAIGTLLLISSSSTLYAAQGAIKVECWGNCDRVTVGQVCDSYSVNSIPIAIACDDVADPGRGSRVACGNGATCTPYGSIYRSDLVGAYCKDGGGNDVIVTCATGSTITSYTSRTTRGVEDETAVQKYSDGQQP